MAKLNFDTVCPCGQKTIASIRKPTRFANSFAKVTCKECGTRFMLSCVRDKSKVERIFATHIDLLFLSPKASDVQARRIKVKAGMLLEKIIGKSAPDNTVIETHMDEVE